MAHGSDPRPPTSATAIASWGVPGPTIGASRMGCSIPNSSISLRSGHVRLDWPPVRFVSGARGVPGPGERLLQSVIAPEQLAIVGDEGGRAENSGLLREPGLLSHGVFHLLFA